MARRSPRRRAGSPALYIAGGLVVVGGGAVALWLLSQRRQPVSDQPRPPASPPGPSPGTPQPAAPASSPEAPAPSGPTSSDEDEARETPPPDQAGPRVRAEVLQRLDRYAAIFDQAAADTAVPAAWLKGIAAAESGGNPDSGKGGSGYKGIMQARRTVDQLDPATSIRTGAKKLADFIASLKKNLGAGYTDLSEEGELRVLAMGYNAGPGVIYKATEYARAAGDVRKWQEPEYYTRALIFYGSYNTRAYAPKGTTDEAIKEAEGWRLRSRTKGLTLDQLKAQGAPALVIRAIEQKQARTAPYLDKIVAYARHYDAPAVA